MENTITIICAVAAEFSLGGQKFNVTKKDLGVVLTSNDDGHKALAESLGQVLVMHFIAFVEEEVKALAVVVNTQFLHRLEITVNNMDFREGAKF